MAQRTHYPFERSVRTLLLALGFATIAGCSSETGTIESEAVPTTSPASTSTTGGTSATTEPDDADPAIDPGPRPGTIWGVEAGSYDLVRIQSGSGDIIDRIAGWGSDAASGEQEGGAQALQEIAAKGDNLWVGDCCEPAVGTVFRVVPGVTTSVPDAEIRVNGTTPVLSPDGTRLAVAVLDLGVAVHDGDTGELIVSPELIGAATTPPDGIEPPFFAAPVAWIDDDTLAVAVNGPDAATVTIVSVADPSAPSAVGSVITIDGPVVDGAVRSDGALVIAVEMTNGEVGVGRVYSTETGEQEATFPLDPATTAIDYDRSGTFLLVARENLPPAWQGLGETGELGGGPLVFAAWDDA